MSELIEDIELFYMHENKIAFDCFDNKGVIWQACATISNCLSTEQA